MQILSRSPRTLAAVGLVAGGLSFTAADLVRRLLEPAHPTPATLAGTAGQHTTAWLVAGLLSALLPFLLLPGLGVLAAAVDGRGARVVRTGAGLLGVGSVAASVHASGYFGMYDVLARSGVDDAAVRAVDSASESSPFFVPFIALFMAGMLVGPIVLGVGLRRARLAPVWAPIAAVVFAVAGGTGGVAAGVVGLVAFVALSAAAARTLRLASPDANAEHRGPRPAGGPVGRVVQPGGAAVPR
ncbi:MAG: hypothetical protein ACTHKG_17190 [Nocardioides sp.]